MLLLMTVSQILQFGSMALLARWYAPAEIGVLSQLTALLLFFAPWGALCMSYTFVLSQTSQEKYNLLVVSRLLCGALAVTFVCILAFLPAINDLNILSILLLLPFALYATAMISVYQQWFYSSQQFSLPSYLLFVSTIVLVGGRLTIGGTERDYQGLLYLTLLVPIGTVILLRGYIGIEHAIRRGNLIELVNLLRKYRQFPLYQAPQQALNAVSQQAPILLFAIWYSAEVTGYYALSLACLGAPVAILSKALGDWLYPQLAQSSGKKFSKLLLNWTLGLSVLGLVPLFCLLFAHQAIFSWIFGAQWSQAGHIASILAPWYFLVAVNTPALKAIMVMQAQKYTLLLNIVTTVLRIGGITTVYIFGADIMDAVWWLSICGIAHNALVIGGAFVIDRKRSGATIQVTS
jgi:O-antigen/teichoic acid export membrane protein